MINISRGKLNRPQKVVIYGSEGIGKSTLAAQFPSPLFIDTEGGTDHMDVRRISKPLCWEELVSDVNEVSKTPEVCKSLVLDTADWAEQLCITHICVKYKKSGLEEFGYGKGFTYLAEEFGRLLTACDAVIAAGINVVITAHAKMRKFEQPDEMGSYDRWEMKLSKQVAPLLKEWCDMLLFLNFKTYVVTADNNARKAQGGNRVIYTSHHPCWDAKNRHGLPEELPVDFAGISHLFKEQPAEAPTTVSDTVTPASQKATDTLNTLLQMMLEANVLDEEVRKVVADKGHCSYSTKIGTYPAEFITGWIIPHWKQIVETIEADPDRLPF